MKTYEDGLMRAIEIVYAVSGELGRADLELGMVLADLQAELSPSPVQPVPAHPFVPGLPYPMARVDAWPRVDGMLSRPGVSMILRSVADYNRDWMVKSIQSSGMIKVPERMRSMPGHVVFACIGDIADALLVQPDQIIQWMGA